MSLISHLTPFDRGFSTQISPIDDFFRLCRDYVGLIFPGLCEAKCAVHVHALWPPTASISASFRLAHIVENWFEYLPVFIDISGQLRLLCLT